MIRLAFLLLLALPATARAEEVRGAVRPVHVADLAPLIDGTVEEIAVREGARVRRGDVLLRMNDDVQQARVVLARTSAEATGEIRQAEAALAEAQAVAARTAAAASRGAATPQELGQAQARAATARAAVQAATERRAVEERRLATEIAVAAQYAIRAPFDGEVTRIEVAPGASLSRTDHPLTVADLSMLEAVLFVPARLVHLLHEGDMLTLHLGAPVGRDVQARLRHIDPQMEGGSARFRCVFVIDNPGSTMPAGMEARLDLPGIGG